MLRKMQLMTVLIGLSWAVGGCVSMGKYDLKEKEACETSKTLQEMRQKNAELTRENSDLKAQIEKLNGTVSGLTKERDHLTADNRKLDDMLKAKSDELMRNITELRQKSADLENENARFKGDIVNLQKARVEEVQKTSKTYEEMLEKMKNEISQGQVTISELKGKLTVNMVDAVLFDSGKVEVKPEGLTVLQKLVNILKSVKGKAIRIEGHTDKVQVSGDLAGRYPTNWELSAARAVNVTRFLQQRGIDPGVLSAVAYGEFQPVTGNDTEEGKARNRRIEIILVPREAP